MTTRKSVPADVRWFLTPLGESALDDADLCICDIRIQGILFACNYCGTVYGSFKDAHVQQVTRLEKTRRS